MTTRNRLIVLIALFVVVLLAISVLSVTQINTLDHEYTKVVDNTIPSMYKISQIRGAVNRVAILEKWHIIYYDEAEQLTAIENEMTQKIAEVDGMLDEYENELTKDIAESSSLFDEDKLVMFDDEREILSRIRQQWQDYLVVHEKVIQLSMNYKFEEASIISSSDSMDRFNELIDSFQELANTDVQIANEMGAAAQQTGREISMLVISIAVTSILLSIGLGLFMASRIISPINRLTQVARQIASGNLEQRAQEDSSETGILGRAFNLMSSNLRERIEIERAQRESLQEMVQKYVGFLTEVSRGNLTHRIETSESDDPMMVLGQNINLMTASLAGMIAQIRDAAANLNSASAEILAATTQQASAATEQSAAMAQTTTTVDEVKAIAEQSSLRAREVSGAAQRTVEVSQLGLSSVQETIESMAQIKDRVEGIAENILALSEQTQQIGEIISTVNDLASQSNMLALNASVEAARAGEHGKGFAVVAMEVRNLAEQSRQATAQVKAILSEIQKATNTTVMATEEGNKGVDRGVQLASHAQQSIEQLSSVIVESSQAAMQMAAGGQQQTSGIEQISMAMSNINQAVVQSLASTRQAERAAQNLNALSLQLNELVAQYQV